MALIDLIKKQQAISNAISETIATTRTTEKTPVNAVASQGTLTVDTQPTAGDTMTIGGKVYTFTADGTAAADGEIDVGVDLAGAQANIVAAINGTDGINTAHPLVSAAAFSTNASVITALTKGAAGDDIATTETFTAATNVFDAATLGTTTAGVNGTIGLENQIVADNDYLYVAVKDNGIHDANWERVGISSF
jgi:hypothetical protein